MFIWTLAQEAYQLSQIGQFFHMAPQLDLDASIVIVSLEETWPRWTHCWRPSIENHHLMAGTYSGSTYKILWLSLCGLTLFLVNHCCNSRIWSKPSGTTWEAAAIRLRSVRPHFTDIWDQLRQSFMVIESRTKPRYNTVLHRVRQLFSLFNIKPSLRRCNNTSFVLLHACCLVGAHISQSSM